MTLTFVSADTQEAFIERIKIGNKFLQHMFVFFFYNFLQECLSSHKKFDACSARKMLTYILTNNVKSSYYASRMEPSGKT